MMKKIGFLPIDNRPVCYDLPKMIANIDSEVKMYLPPKNLLGSLTRNADRNALFEWLEDLNDVDYLVISVDTLIYGGLISSRRSSDTKDEIENRLLKLRNILLKKANCKTLIFSSIMRISNNNCNEEEKEYWADFGKKIFEYSFELHRSEIEGNRSAKEKATQVAKEIPSEILIDWLSTRERNFSVNKEYVKMFDDGIFDTLIFSKDDCAKYGFNVKEAKYFELLAQTRKGMFVKTGADEIPLTLLSRCISDGKKIKIAPIYTNPDEVDKISKYEDVSVKKSVESQILTAGGSVSSPDEADLILYVNNFKGEQGELVMNVDTEPFDGEFAHFDKPYFVVDILNANGTDNKFVEKMFENGINGYFYGYSAWNTTGNSLGSGIAAAVTKFLAKNPDENAFKKLQTVRLLDDWAYQANLRKEFKRENLMDMNEIKNRFSGYEKEVAKALKVDTSKISYFFPWDRFFEIEVKI